MSVIIVGAGIAGTTLALSLYYLTQGKQDITLVEAISPDRLLSPSDDGRTIALAYGICNRINILNIWSLLEPIATTITRVYVGERGSGGFFSLNSTDHGIPFLGKVFELNQAKKKLFFHLQQTKNISLYCPNKITCIKKYTDYLLITLDNGKQIKGDLLVAADGTSSHIADLYGIKWKKIVYEQTAVVTKISTQLLHYGQAFELFTKQGSLALLPISDGFSSLIWCTSRTEIKTISNWNDKEFITYLQNIFGWRLGKIQTIGKRYFYPIESKTRVNTIAPRLVLVSNAAQTLHPIAGQGLNLGMRDILILADTLINSWKEGRQAGDYMTLQKYQNKRIIDRQTTIFLTNSLVRIFSNPYLTLFIGRTIGLIMIDNIRFLRNILVQCVIKSLDK
ncbi:2-octaprenyl-6-methoxyphenyl hydroxylase [Candidatus Erwinia haradaeae]|uniref:2-octaprenyl-6-methoxyphenol hydroxylase n=1 Tax=Candidatus Erwinia haradaeae TaxID=1922217 RepID=A0A803GCZ6_9GAMM|nr:2-octaprenyl-6-methoxyphenyl hydroxylase [Candidatus Erwinia haradaeae]VFP88858.1 2-octaprenyl-6-methoxyphenol hydroxylase [Candidatus Erwinia haradaeae]